MPTFSILTKDTLLRLIVLKKTKNNQLLSAHLVSVCALYLCCYSLLWRAAPWAFLCHLGGADHKGRSRAIQTETGWGRVSGSQRHKQCGQSHMTPQTGSRLLPLVWGASAPTDRQHERQWGWEIHHGAWIFVLSLFVSGPLFSKIRIPKSLCTLVYMVDLGRVPVISFHLRERSFSSRV